MKFDDVLQEAGEFGWYQKRLLVVICLTGGFVLIQNLSPVFTMAIPKHRCKIPGLPNDTYEVQSEQHAWLINRTIPVTVEGDFSQCTIYDVTDLGAGGDFYDITIKEAGMSGFNRTERPCEQWVYDRSMFTETLTSQLNLVCDKKMYRSHSSMMIFAGKLVGAFLTSASADYFGRRRVYTFAVMAMVASTVGIVFVTSLPALMALRFLVGGTTTASYLCAYVIGLELMGKSHRRFISISFKIASITMDFMALGCAYLLRHWSHFQASLVVPCLFIIVGFFFIPESPRWLMSKGRVQEVRDIMNDVARVNGAPALVRLQSLMAEDDLQLQQQPSSVTAKAGAVSPVQLFRIPRLFVRYNVLFLCWILLVMNTYGLMLNVSTMSGNIFQNFSILLSMDFLALLIVTLLIERIGRRPLLASVTTLAGVSCLATVLPTVLGRDSWILRMLSMVGRMGTNTGMSVIYVMSPELYPTVLRSFGLGACSMMARLGGIASPYVADLNVYVSGVWGPALPQVVFGVAGLMTSAMMLVLPETKGRRLPETIQDAIDFGKRDERAEQKELTITAQEESKM